MAKTTRLATKLLLISACAAAAIACTDETTPPGSAPGGSGGSGATGGTGGSGGTGGTGGTGGGTVADAVLTEISVGSASLAGGAPNVVDNRVVHTGPLDSGGTLQPPIRIAVDGDLGAVSVHLSSADGAFEVLDAELAVENGEATLELDEPLHVNIPYRLRVTPVGAQLHYGETEVEGAIFCFFVQDSYTLSADADRFGPVVSHVAFEAGLTQGASAFDVVAAAVDPSGIAQLGVGISTVEQGAFGPRVEVGLTYDPLSCLFDGSASIPSYLPDGPWSFATVVAADRKDGAPNSSVLTSDPFLSRYTLGGPVAIALDTIERVGGTPDTEPPVLEGAEIEYTAGTAHIRVQATDAGSGIEAVLVSLSSESGSIETELSSGAEGWSGAVEIPAWMPGASWYVSRVELRDAAANTDIVEGESTGNFFHFSCTLSCEQVFTDIPVPTFERTGLGEVDERAPAITRIALSPAGPIAELPATRTVELDATDVHDSGASSGVREASVTFCSPGQTIFRQVFLTAGAGDTWTGTLELWPTDPRGTWSACNITVSDHAQRTAYLTAEGETYAVDGAATTVPVLTFDLTAPDDAVDSTIDSVVLSNDVFPDVVDLALQVTEGGAGVIAVSASFSSSDRSPETLIVLTPQLHRVEPSLYLARFSMLPGYTGGAWQLDTITILHADGSQVRYEADTASGVYTRIDERFQQTPTTLEVPTLDK